MVGGVSLTEVVGRHVLDGLIALRALISLTYLILTVSASDINLNERLNYS